MSYCNTARKQARHKATFVNDCGREIVSYGINQEVTVSVLDKLRCMDSIGKAKHLTMNERGLLLILYRLSTDSIKGPQEWAWPTINLLAEEMGKSRETVKRTVRALENKGFLTVRETRNRYGFKEPNQYRVEYGALIADAKKYTKKHTKWGAKKPQKTGQKTLELTEETQMSRHCNSYPKVTQNLKEIPPTSESLHAHDARERNDTNKVDKENAEEKMKCAIAVPMHDTQESVHPGAQDAPTAAPDESALDVPATAPDELAPDRGSNILPGNSAPAAAPNKPIPPRLRDLQDYDLAHVREKVTAKTLEKTWWYVWKRSPMSNYTTVRKFGKKERDQLSTLIKRWPDQNNLREIHFFLARLIMDWERVCSDLNVGRRDPLPTLPSPGNVLAMDWLYIHKWWFALVRDDAYRDETKSIAERMAVTGFDPHRRSAGARVGEGKWRDKSKSEDTELYDDSILSSWRNTPEYSALLNRVCGSTVKNNEPRSQDNESQSQRYPGRNYSKYVSHWWKPENEDDEYDDDPNYNGEDYSEDEYYYSGDDDLE